MHSDHVVTRRSAVEPDGYINEATFSTFDHIRFLQGQDCPAPGGSAKRFLARMLLAKSTQLSNQDKGYRGLGFQLLLQGEGQLSWGFQSRNVSVESQFVRGGGILMPSGDAGWIDGQLFTSDFTLLSVEFPLDTEIAGAFGRSLHMDTPYRYVRDNPAISRLCVALWYEATLGLPGGVALSQRLRHYLLSLLSHQPGKCPIADDGLFLANIVKYIHEYSREPILDDDISLQAKVGQLSATWLMFHVADLCRSTFTRWWNRLVPHMTCKQYAMRVESALSDARVARPGDQLRKIASDMRRHPSTLTKRAKARFGKTPSELRMVSK